MDKPLGLIVICNLLFTGAFFSFIAESINHSSIHQSENLAFAQQPFIDKGVRRSIVNNSESFQPDIVAVANNVYIVWAQNGSSGSDILFSRSTDYGRHFEDPVILTSTSSNYNYYRDPAIAAEGENVYVVWSAYNSPMRNAILFTMSANSGSDFDAVPATRITNESRDSSHADISADAGIAYVVWESRSAGDFFHDVNILFSVFDRSAQRFSETRTLSTPGIESLDPGIVAYKENNVYITWNSRQQGTDHILRVESNDRGNSFGSHIQVSTPSNSIDKRNISPRIAGTKSIVWTGYNVGSLPILNYLSGASAPSSAPTLLSSPAEINTVSDIAASLEGQEFVVWGARSTYSDGLNNYEIWYSGPPVSSSPLVLSGGLSNQVDPSIAVAPGNVGTRGGMPVIYVVWTSEETTNPGIMFWADNEGTPNTGHIEVNVSVINNDGGTASPPDFTLEVIGSNPSPKSFPGDVSPVPVNIESGPYNITVGQMPKLYNISEMSGECIGNIAVGQAKSCTIIFDDVPINGSPIPPNGNMTMFDNETSRTTEPVTEPGATTTQSFFGESEVPQEGITTGEQGTTTRPAPPQIVDNMTDITELDDTGGELIEEGGGFFGQQ